jgi:hypothetical protein
MELKFVAAKKPTNDDPIMQRRQRLVRRLDQQISLIKSAVDGMPPRTSWVWMDDTGAYFLPIKYGRTFIELQKGMFAVQCDCIEDVGQGLAAIRAMVLQGDFDAQLQKASTEIRSKFSKK